MYGCGESRVQNLVGKFQGKRPTGKPRRRCYDNSKMDLQDVGCRVVNWIELAQNRAGGGHL